MHIIREPAELTTLYANDVSTGATIGFVPTMGALHEGHLSLIRMSKIDNDLTVCSIFVNPTQFDNPTDLRKYPRMPEKDIQLLRDTGCDVVFLPDKNTVYPNGDSTIHRYDYGELEIRLEGAHRPGHFTGVGQVVARLLELVNPNRLYLGQKDYQQYLLLNKLITEILRWPVEVICAPIIREPDGLAMSSRNLRLTAAERSDATVIFQALKMVKENAGTQTPDFWKRKATSLIKEKNTIQSVDYFEIARQDDLTPLDEWNPQIASIALAAVRMPTVRLIDNMLLN